MRTTTDPATRFTGFYQDCYPDVLRFVQRRLADGADDVVADAFTVAWRRIDELPRDPDDARAWVFGIARNCLLNQRRGERRRDALSVRLATQPLGPTDLEAELAVSRIELARAWQALDPDDQDVVALSVLDGLTSEHAGRVLEISAVAYRHRLSRARARLRRLLDEATSPAASAALTSQETR